MHQLGEEIAVSFFRADATEHEMKAFICSDVSGYTNCALVCQSLYNGPEWTSIVQTPGKVHGLIVSLRRIHKLSSSSVLYSKVEKHR